MNSLLYSTIIYLKGSQVDISKLKCQSLNSVFIIANGADPEKVHHDATFPLGYHCLPNYPFRGFQYTKGLFPIILRAWSILTPGTKSGTVL